ncbi:MAG: DJ-1/PfpI family protein [Deltaproteobacteria bacterium]
MTTTTAPLRIGLLVFPRMTQLDATAPYEVFARLPDVETLLVAPTDEPVVTEFGLTLVPSCSLEAAPPLDVLCVPGGPGIGALIDDDRVLDLLARHGANARYVTSVCTGALVLGAAGLLQGHRATTHWLSLDLLALVGAIPVAERVVVDRNRVTGGGVTAGIDFALRLAMALRGEAVARRIQLLLEYDPSPPFDSGSPQAAADVASLRAERGALQDRRRAQLVAAVGRAPERWYRGGST